MKTAMRNLLIGDPLLASLTPGGVSWGIHGQGIAGDYIVLQVISRVPDRLMAGRGSLTTYRVQIDCYAQTDLDAEAMAQSVERILDGYKSEPFQGILFVTGQDLTDGDENQPIHRASLDFTVVYRG